MSVNIELLKEVRGVIAEEPRRLDMAHWGKFGLDVESNSNYPPCGTVACLAGWIVFTGEPKLREQMESSGHRFIDSYLWNNFHKEVDDRAAELIGIPKADCPFYETEWEVPDVLAWIDRQIDAASK